MRRSTLAAVLVLGLGTLIICGCDHKVALTFINHTQQARDVEVNVPGGGSDFLGTVGPGLKKKTTVKINKDDLPVELTWTAGDIGGKIAVDSNVKTRIVHIEPGGSTTIDKKDEVHKAESEDTTTKVKEGTIVE